MIFVLSLFEDSSTQPRWPMVLALVDVVVPMGYCMMVLSIDASFLLWRWMDLSKKQMARYAAYVVAEGAMVSSRCYGIIISFLQDHVLKSPL
jgi:hypothetical protein